MCVYFKITLVTLISIIEKLKVWIMKWVSDCFWKTSTDIDVRKGLEIICLLRHWILTYILPSGCTSNLLSRNGNISTFYSSEFFFLGSSNHFEVMTNAWVVPLYPWCHQRSHLSCEGGSASSGFIFQLLIDILTVSGLCKVIWLPTVGARTHLASVTKAH